MTEKSPFFIQLRIDGETKARFFEACKAKGVTPSVWLRERINDLIEHHELHKGKEKPKLSIDHEAPIMKAVIELAEKYIVARLEEERVKNERCNDNSRGSR
jgi:antitoxin component of RelBE/YafQ-DinJ toxin-antitoxin module